LNRQRASITFFFKLGKKYYRNFSNIGSSFWRADSGKEYKFLGGFAGYKAV
jgi:hypothetical protein